MEAIDVLVIGSGLALLALVVNQQQKDQSFSDLMDSVGGSETDISGAIAVSDTSASQQQQTSGVSIADFANAIFQREGGSPGDRNVRNNNPGNLKAAPDQFTGSVTQRDSGGFVVFPTADSGWAALNAQISKWINESPSLNLNQFFAKYLGQADYLNPQVTSQGDPFKYADFVAGRIGVDPNQTLGSITWVN